MMTDPAIIAALIGLFIGLMVAITGAGGGILSLPLLMFFLSLSMHQAAPIALMAVFAASAYASVIGLWQGIVRYKAATLMAITGVLLAPLGVVTAHKLPSLLLQLLFVAVLIYVAVMAWLRAKDNVHIKEDIYSTAAPCEINPVTSKFFWTANCTKRLTITGGIAGFLSGLLGVGGGFIVVPSMQKISNLEHRMIVATSLAMVTLVSFVGIVSYAGHADINWNIALPFVGASLAGSLAGRHFFAKLSPHVSHVIFSIMAMTIAAGMLLRIIL